MVGIALFASMPYYTLYIYTCFAYFYTYYYTYIHALLTLPYYATLSAKCQEIVESKLEDGHCDFCLQFFSLVYLFTIT